ncbi:MAG: tetratricopeptide repeat protein, partial [Balneolales bacterium]
MFKIFSLTLFLISFIFYNVSAQQGNDFMIANELLRQGEYQEAYEILDRLHKENPDSYPVFDRLIATLINLKSYDEAIRLSEDQFRNDYKDIIAAAQLGELYHMAGDTTRAIEVWNTTLDSNSGNLQAYRHIANTMNGRRLHTKANRIYLEAREKHNQPDLFASELANNQLIIGDYEDAMQEYLNLIAYNNDYSFQVQRQLMQFDEPYLFDIAILETEEKIDDYSSTSHEAAIFREFLIWLYMERNLYRRALFTARNLESSSVENRYAVFELGDRLRVLNEYELAESAFSFYTEHEQHEMKARSMEKLAQVYMSWANYLETNNLDYNNQNDSLYNKANQILHGLIENYPRYENLSEIYLLQAELALDHLKDSELANQHYKKLLALPEDEDLLPRIDYVDGRIKLLNSDYTQARIAFTQSNRAVRIGSLADKTRYYLALTDFFSSDYDFSQIQMRALERQNTSFFANNALRLRLWIQEGINADSTTTELDAFSKAQYHYQITGQTDKAIEILSPLLINSNNHPLFGEAMLLATSIIRDENSSIAYNLINDNFDKGL